ncbi:MAG TPA: type II toxin-antitoxin system VapB family antitoxin [Phenylobacterium sp.]|nr:type II toxin-antitoxin system VapB family antitoxin [Phenylobacterium sp.]
MAVIIRDPQTVDLIRETAAEERVGLTAVVRKAMQDYRSAKAKHDDKAARMQRLRAILEEFDKAPVLDPRSSQELMDDLYDEHGLPK